MVLIYGAYSLAAQKLTRHPVIFTVQKFGSRHFRLISERKIGQAVIVTVSGCILYRKVGPEGEFAPPLRKQKLV